MFRKKILSLFLIFSLLVVTFATTGKIAYGQSLDNGVSWTAVDNVDVWVVLDGGKQVIPVLPQPGVMEKLPNGITRTEFMAKHSMPSELESKIVHNIPMCPVIIDGVQYQPEQIRLFDGQRLGFTVGNDGCLYAFTSDEALVIFEQQQKTSENQRLGVLTTLSFFYENINRGGKYIAADPGIQLPDLRNVPTNYDNLISCEEINVAATSATLFADYDYWGDYFDRAGGTYISSLVSYGWNDVASSLIVWWF
jgi:hypothetical protein